MDALFFLEDCIEGNRVIGRVEMERVGWKEMEVIEIEGI